MKILFVKGSKPLIDYLQVLGLPVMQDGEARVGFMVEPWFKDYDKKKVTKNFLSFLGTLDGNLKASWGKWKPIDIFYENEPLPKTMKSLFDYYSL